MAMWLEVGDRVRNRRGQTGVVLEVNDTEAEVQSDNRELPG
jgi:hypothetical protein